MSDIQNISHVKKTPVFVFDRQTGLEKAKMLSKYGSNWPVVYIIYDAYKKASGRKNLYIGETTSFSNRFSQHLDNAERGGNKEGLDYITIICNDTFHKSAILDMEQTLIRLFQADGYYHIVNLNSGQSAFHDYYDRVSYQMLVPNLWNKLQLDFGRKRDESQRIIINKNYQDLINSDIYKYSPYITLTDEQLAVSLDVLLRTIDGLNNGVSCTSVVNGGAGTGKTILAIHMINEFFNSELINKEEVTNDDENLSEISKKSKLIVEGIKKYKSTTGKDKLSIAFVVPMDSLRKTLETVFKSINMPGTVISVADLANSPDKFDVVFVDESHRLTRRVALQSYPDFDSKTQKLQLPEGSTQLDWVICQSKTRVLFYDAEQSVRTRDITPEDFDRSVSGTYITNGRFNLLSQMRCGGGLPFIQHINDIFDQYNPHILNIDQDLDYKFLLFESFKDMRDEIFKYDEEFGLCRIVSGISWKNWHRKTKQTFDDFVKENYPCNGKAAPYLQSLSERNPEKLRDINKRYVETGDNCDIEIDGVKVAWNSSMKGWVISPNAKYEMGCIHTIQGYDVNYIGIVFGPEIDYSNGAFVVYKDAWRISDGKSIEKKSYEEIVETAINTYKVMLKRGVKGCFVYAYNEGLRNYLKQYIKVYNNYSVDLNNKAKNEKPEIGNYKYEGSSAHRNVADDSGIEYKQLSPDDDSNLS